MTVRPLLLVMTALLATVEAQAPAPTASGVTAERRAAKHFERIHEDPLALRSFLYAFPKGADLHNHLSGSVYAESYIAWAAEMPLCIDVSSHTFVEADETESRVTCRNSTMQRPAADALRDPKLYRDIVDALSMRNHHPARGPGENQFFDTFDKFQAISRGGQPGSEASTGKSLAEAAHRAGLQNVHHVEFILGADDGRPWELAKQAPRNAIADLDGYREALLAEGLRDAIPDRRRWLDAVEEIMRAGLKCGTRDASPGCRVSVRYIAYVLRAFPPELVFAQMLFAFELASADPRVVAVNPVQPEDWLVSMRDYDVHMRMFDVMHRHYPHVNITLHAGELAFGQVPPQELGRHIRQAIGVGRARRIGHGVDVMHDARADDLLRTMAAQKIAVEINLTSNDYILGLRGPRHPLRQYLRAGVPVALSTDNEGVERIDLTHEYQRAVEEHDVSYAELKRISRDSLEYSFLPAEQKNTAKHRLERAFAVFESRF